MLKAILLSEEWRHRSYVVAFKMKVLPIGSLAPLRASIDLVTVLNMSPNMTGENLDVEVCNAISCFLFEVRGLALHCGLLDRRRR
ncbi:hypothetical protein B296_00003283 [Ensete ventricosum]|uniref:Uncharacterized protein n=1 Tax=Ensete ventricosum TaxID=4639 RepID=A0A427B0V2_ENSVE|nr:hypothetical protein B296_00003283 [Ensete ventricosum]